MPQCLYLANKRQYWLTTITNDCILFFNIIDLQQRHFIMCMTKLLMPKSKKGVLATIPVGYECVTV